MAKLKNYHHLELIGIGLALLALAVPYIWHDVSTYLSYPILAVGILLTLWGLWHSSKVMRWRGFESRSSNKLIRAQLGAFSIEGKRLLNLCGDETKAHPVKEIASWDNKAKQYLGNLDLPLQALFSDPSGIPFGKGVAPKPGSRDEDWEGIRVRLQRLREFIDKYPD